MQQAGFQVLPPSRGAPGWAGVKATHTGGYLGCLTTGKSLVINGLGYWKREGEMYIENRVFVDLIHLFRQLGVDLFARLDQLVNDKEKQDNSIR